MRRVGHLGRSGLRKGWALTLPVEGAAETVDVLHCLWNAPIGGAARAVFQLVGHQSAGGMRVGVLLGGKGGYYFDQMSALPVERYLASARSSYDLRRLPAMVRVMKQYRIHHFHSAEPLMFAASVLSGSDKVRVFTERGGPTHLSYGRKKAIRNALAGLLLRRFFHRFSGNTLHAATSASSRYGLAPDRFDVTYNGIDLSLLAPRETREAARMSLGLEDETVAIGTSAYLKDWKRIDLIFAACARLDDVEVIVIGDGPDRKRLERCARDLGVEARVRFVGMQTHVADHVQALDAFVLASREFESFGNAVVEAMALGVPSIVFQDSPGLCEHIVHGETGYIVADVEQLASVIHLLAEDRNLRQSVGARASEFVRMRYSLDAMRDGYAAFYENALRAV